MAFVAQDFNLPGRSILSGLVIGLMSAWLFSRLFPVGMEILKGQIKENFIELDAPEILYAGWGNRKRAWVRDGGKLYLLPTLLVFKPHYLNTNAKKYIIPLDEVTEVRPAKYLGELVGIEVLHRSGKDAFILEKERVNDWLMQLKDVAKR